MVDYFVLKRLYSRCIKLNRIEINPSAGNAYANGANDTNREKDPNFISFKPKSSIY